MVTILWKTRGEETRTLLEKKSPKDRQKTSSGVGRPKPRKNLGEKIEVDRRAGKLLKGKSKVSRELARGRKDSGGYGDMVPERA